jgi:hypothetical protein
MSIPDDFVEYVFQNTLFATQWNGGSTIDE